MAVFALTDVDLFVGHLEEGCFAREAMITTETVELDATTICAGRWRRVVGGIKSTGLSASGPQDLRIESVSNGSSLTYSAGIGTVTTSSSHSFGVGDAVTLSGYTPSGWDGEYVILTTPSSTTFTILAPSTLSNASSQGRVYKLTGPDALFQLNTGTNYAYSMSPAGGEGSVAFFGEGMLRTVSPLQGSVGELATHQVELVGRTPLIRGQLELAQTLTTTTNSTGVQLGAVSASQRIWAAVHVLSLGGTSPSPQVLIQSDDNSGFSSATTRITGSLFTAVGSEFLSLVGPVTDDWWRVRVALGGTTPTALVRVAIGVQ